MSSIEHLRTFKEFENNQQYAINFRNAYNGIHGLIVFNNELEALRCAEQLSELETGDFLEFYDVANFIQEIDYNDIKDIENCKFYNNIKIVNNLSIDLYNI